jgi:hypothetical protein
MSSGDFVQYEPILKNLSSALGLLGSKWSDKLCASKWNSGAICHVLPTTTHKGTEIIFPSAHSPA